MTITFSWRAQESSVQFVEPVQTDSTSRITYLWCIRSGTPATGLRGQPQRRDQLRVGLGRRRHGDRVGVIDVVHDPDGDSAPGGLLQGARRRRKRSRGRGGSRIAPGRASAVRARGTTPARAPRRAAAGRCRSEFGFGWRSSSSEWPTPGSARPSTSIVTGGEPPGAGTVCAPTSSPGARRRCSSSERPRATAGARVSGIPFTSERQLTGRGPAEATATIVRRVLAELELEEETLCWNVVPTHPHRPGCPETNRRPTRAEIEVARPFLRELARGRRTIAVGRLAQSVLGGPYVRHPSHGGAAEFRSGLLAFRPGGQESAAFSE